MRSAACAGCSVSPRAGIWAWRRREPSARASANAQLTGHIVQIHQASRGTYGAFGSRPNCRRAGCRAGTTVSRGSCARPVWWAAIGGGRCAYVPPGAIRRRCQLPIWSSGALPLLAPDQLWIADITYLPTEQEGFLYLSVILDVFSRRVVGWSMQDHLRTELVLAALEMAVGKRRPEAGLIHHSDHGCQYTSVRFGERCATAGIHPSMGTVGDCFDNAMVESFFATLECELLAQHRFQTHNEARAAVFEWLEVFYNRQRRHSALGYLAPAVYEQTVTKPTSGAA